MTDKVQKIKDWISKECDELVDAEYESLPWKRGPETVGGRESVSYNIQNLFGLR